jgi:alpha-tubulin suppressor-like RCC1 family protein
MAGQQTLALSIKVRILVPEVTAPSSSGQDGSLSRFRPEFDSPWGHLQKSSRSKGLGLFCFVLLLLAGCPSTKAPTKPIPTPASRPSSLPLNIQKGSLYLGTIQSCYLHEQKDLWCWGRDAFGNLGRGEIGDQMRPARATQIEEVVSAAIGEWWGCALRNNGSVWCWGNNSFGQLGNGENRSLTTPVQVKSLTDAVQITAGESHACALSGSSSRVYCWGFNGDGSVGFKGPPDFNTPQLVPKLSDVTQIDAGAYHTCALVKGGDVWCWGSNSFGQLASPDSEEIGPIKVKGLPPAKAVSAGGDRSCALTYQETLYCWGVAHLATTFGEKAQSSSYGTMYYTTPILMDGFAELTSLSVGVHQSCALTREKKVRCINTTNDGKDSIIAATLLNDVVEISAGASTCARLEDQTVWCWGNNLNGTVGNGKKTNWEKPFKIWPAK